MAEHMYNLHRNNMNSFIQHTTHWHRLAQYGLEKDLFYCVSEDVAPVLPLYNKAKGQLQAVVV
jgi:2-phosphosulfolactate phosphatase